MPYGSSTRSTEPSTSAAHARPVTAAPERHADHDVRGAPENRDERQRGERGGRDPGGELSPAARRARCDQRDRADAERERRQSDERGQQTPEDEENADQVDVGGHRIGIGIG